MTDTIKNLMNSGQVINLVTEKDGVVEYHKVQSYYGDGEFWWIKSAPEHRGVEWDRETSLSFTSKPQSKYFSVGRQRLMLLATEGINPKVKFMASYDSVKMTVAKHAKPVWDHAKGDDFSALVELLRSGKTYRLLISEGDGAWLNIGIDSAEFDLQKQQFKILTELSPYPVMAVNDLATQNKQVDQVYSYLTINNNYQPEDAKVRESVAEFDMAQVDLWRGIFENGVFISAYSATQGKSFNYKELKLIDCSEADEYEIVNI